MSKIDNFLNFPKEKTNYDKKERGVCGTGFNDSEFKIQVIISGKKIDYLPYQCWSHMLSRVYNPKDSNHHRYFDCTVSDEWLLFSNFEKFFIENYQPDYELDKDLLIEGNRIYSKETCVFVPSWLNKLFLINEWNRGDLSLGVSFDNLMVQYNASVSIDGIMQELGLFDTEWEAEIAYLEAKSENVLHAIEDPEMPEILKEPLRQRAVDMIDRIEILEETNNVEDYGVDSVDNNYGVDYEDGWDENIWEREETITDEEY